MPQEISDLEMSALQARSLQDALKRLAMQAESEIPGSLAGFVLVSSNGLAIAEGIFPSLPPSFEKSLANITVALPFVGTCAEAIITGKPVIKSNIRTDTVYDPKWRELCMAAGFISVQSWPVCDERTRPLGTFVLGFKEPATPERWDGEFMKRYAALACAAIKSHNGAPAGTMRSFLRADEPPPPSYP